jgi:inhibitor of KinA
MNENNTVIAHTRLRENRTFPLFSPVAEHSVLVEFGEQIDRMTHQQVLNLDKALTSHPFDGFVEAVPAYVSLLVRFDPVLCDHVKAINHLQELLTVRSTLADKFRQHEVGVCYDADLAPNLGQVAETVGLSQDAVIAAHLAGSYDVSMYGFAPGYAYLAGVPEPIHLPRKPAAIRGVAAGSVIIAGPQCLITTLTMPTGWWVIGRSPMKILTGNPARPFLFDVGDRIKFKRISRAEYETESQ